jgi:hypothetical protein
MATMSRSLPERRRTDSSWGRSEDKELQARGQWHGRGAGTATVRTTGGLTTNFNKTQAFFSTDPRTKYVQVPGTCLNRPRIFAPGTFAILTKACAVHNQWDRDRVLAYGLTNANGSVSVNNGGTTLNGGGVWQTGSPVSGPHTRFTTITTPVAARRVAIRGGCQQGDKERLQQLHGTWIRGYQDRSVESGPGIPDIHGERRIEPDERRPRHSNNSRARNASPGAGSSIRGPRL